MAVCEFLPSSNEQAKLNADELARVINRHQQPTKLAELSRRDLYSSNQVFNKKKCLKSRLVPTLVTVQGTHSTIATKTNSSLAYLYAFQASQKIRWTRVNGEERQCDRSHILLLHLPIHIFPAQTWRQVQPKEAEYGEGGWVSSVSCSPPTCLSSCHPPLNDSTPTKYNSWLPFQATPA